MVAVLPAIGKGQPCPFYNNPLFQELAHSLESFLSFTVLMAFISLCWPAKLRSPCI